MATTPEVQRARRHAVGDLVHRSARRHPNKLAIVADGQRLTFGEFDAAVNRVAAALQSRNLRHGDRLALLSHNSLEFALLAIATARLGVVLVPVNFMLGADEVAYILRHSGASAIVVEGALAHVAVQAVEQLDHDVAVRAVVPSPGAAIPDGWDNASTWAAGDDDCADNPGRPDVHVEDDDPVRLMYTSGTESRPKGVVLTSRSLIAQYVSCIVDGGMAADDVEVHSLPLYHCAQLDCFLSVDLYLGATSIVLPGPDPATLLATIEQEHVTKLFAPPTVWISLLRHPDFDTRDLSTLRKGYYGASPMPVAVLHEITARLPGVSLWNFYGQTELAPLATILGPRDQVERAGSAGRPGLNVETRVVDDDGDDVGVGQIGEIVHR